MRPYSSDGMHRYGRIPELGNQRRAAQGLPFNLDQLNMGLANLPFNVDHGHHQQGHQINPSSTAFNLMLLLLVLIIIHLFSSESCSSS